MTVTNKPGHRGSTKETVKTIARGMPGDSGVTVVTMLVCFLHFAREAAGASGARHSLRPLYSGRMVHAQLGRIAPRDRGVTSRRHCEKRSDEAIHSSILGRQRGLLRFARNDVQGFGYLKIGLERALPLACYASPL
jgi:hypothetical protein